jgi:hypothetical protein
MIFIKVLAHSAIIVGVNEIEEKKTSSFSKTFKLGLKYFWQVLAVQLLSFLVTMFLIIILGLPVVMLFVLNMPFRGFILTLLAILIFIPLAILISFTEKYSLRAIVISKKKVFQAIKVGFNIFKANILPSIIIYIILFAINAIVTIMILIILLFLALLFGIPVVVIWSIINIGGGIFGGILLLILGILILAALFAFIGTIFNTFESTLWTLLFRKLAHR